MSSIDTRAESILQWLTHDLNFDIISFEPASSDASFRRYFRVVHNRGQHIVMDAPPDKEDTKPFIQVCELFKRHGVNVPQIFEKNTPQGFLLLQDFGNDCLLDHLNEQSVDRLYALALDSLFTLQSQVQFLDNPLPTYDKTLLNQEINLFYEWFLNQSLELLIPKSLQEELNTILIQSAVEQPKACVHRDFHSRNLMLLNDNSVGVIDFQDAVIGPITYDLVSLLKDCYIAWPEHKIKQWMTHYYHQLIRAELIDSDLDQFCRWFDLMGLQRHLKAIGIFSRLNIRDNKPNYLNDIPQTLNYVTSICARYPELSRFEEYLTNHVLPTYTYLNDSKQTV